MALGRRRAREHPSASGVTTAPMIHGGSGPPRSSRIKRTSSPIWTAIGQRHERSRRHPRRPSSRAGRPGPRPTRPGVRLAERDLNQHRRVATPPRAMRGGTGPSLSSCTKPMPSATSTAQDRSTATAICRCEIPPAEGDSNPIRVGRDDHTSRALAMATQVYTEQVHRFVPADASCSQGLWQRRGSRNRASCRHRCHKMN